MTQQSKADSKVLGDLRPAHLLAIQQHFNHAQTGRVGERFEYLRSLLGADAC